ncbi:MAG: 50S ribosomal protein L5 [Candidatus Diapherotrites archaeon]|nr:50S ribosomal protein L5 [Candidatus Diapherotrites archaeon]
MEGKNKNTGNVMREIRIEKVVVNMGVGQTGEELEKAKKILQSITGMKPAETSAKVRQPAWGIRPGLKIGAKVTLRGEKAIEFLKRALIAKEGKLSKNCFDNEGNFSFGIREHIELPDTKYDPNLGIRGFDICVSLERKGFRIKRRKKAKRRIPKRHRISKEEAIEFVKNVLGVKME